LVADAEYDRNRDVIITVSDSPYRLRMLDPLNRTSSSVDLPLAPKCVSIRPDGLYAAVGHDGFISYVNLSVLEVEMFYAVTCDVSDIVLPMNGWVYAVPRDDSQGRIRSIELSSGNESLQTGTAIRESSTIRLHPSGDYIYSADSYDGYKLDIRVGNASFLYRSSAGIDIASNVWIAGDGNALYDSSGNVYQLSAVRNNDFAYSGSLSESDYFAYVDATRSGVYVYAVPAGQEDNDQNPAEVYIYEGPELTPTVIVELPSISAPDGNGGTREVAMEGVYVFGDSTEVYFHALYRAHAASGLYYDWSITTHRVDDVTGP
jgi:hypothetical protein